MVGRFFFITLFRLLLGAVLLIGPVEYFLHIGTQAYPELSNAHYNFTTTFANETPVPTFVPAIQMCKLPPSQPYAFQLGMNGAKLTSCAVVLGGFPDDLQTDASRWKVAVFRAMTFYQWVMIPITMALTILHFAFYMGPFDSWWHGYECFGILWTLGPWWFNVFLSLMKITFQDGALEQFASSSGTGSSMQMQLRQMLTEPLASKKDMEIAKGKTFGFTMGITTLPYIAIWSPFVITHLLPALLVFLPQNLLVVAIFVLLTWLINYDSNGNRLTLHQLLFDTVLAGNGAVDLERAKDLEKAAGLHYLPMMACIAILSEILVLEATYFYAGDGWFNSMAEAWLERRSDYYFLAFKQKVLAQFYSTADLMNEAT